MLNNIKIRDVQISHGSLVLDNEFFINHFKKQGKDVGHFLNDVLKKDKRYIMNPNKENTLELAINASKKILDNNGLSGNDIDMICFSSQLPEYTAPPSSVLVH